MTGSVPPRLVAALALLPSRQRAVVVLRDVFGWSPSDVAELLGTSVAEVDRVGAYWSSAEETLPFN